MLERRKDSEHERLVDQAMQMNGDVLESFKRIFGMDDFCHVYSIYKEFLEMYNELDAFSMTLHTCLKYQDEL